MSVAIVDREPFEWSNILNGKPISDRRSSGRSETHRAMAEIGSVSLCEMFGDRLDLTYTRDSELVGGRIRLVLLTSGRAAVNQNGRTALLVPGDFAVADAGQPHHISFETRYRCIVVLMDATLFPAKRGDVQRACGLRVSGHRGTGRVAAQFLLSVAQEAFHDDYTSSHDLANALVNVVSAGLAEKLQDSELTPDHGELIHRIRAFIESRLDDPDLTPLDVARAHHISVRYLQRIFEAEGTTVSDWIRRHRLERCRAELIDPRNVRTSISAIAARWGFPDSSYFSRVFKATYDETPRAVRASAALRRTPVTTTHQPPAPTRDRPTHCRA